MGHVALTNIRYTRAGQRAGGVVLKPCGEFRAILTQTLPDGSTSARPFITTTEATARHLVDEWIRSGLIEINNIRRDG